MRVCVLVPRVASVDGIAQRVVLDEDLLAVPIVVVGTAEQDPNA